MPRDMNDAAMRLLSALVVRAGGDNPALDALVGSTIKRMRGEFLVSFLEEKDRPAAHGTESVLANVMQPRYGLQPKR